MVSKVSRKFMTSKLDGFGVKASNAGKVRDGGSVRLLGKRGDIPAALRFIHAREQEVDLVVVASKLGVGPGLAGSTRAPMDNGFGLSCHLQSFPDTGSISASGTYSFMIPYCATWGIF